MSVNTGWERRVYCVDPFSKREGGRKGSPNKHESPPDQSSQEIPDRLRPQGLWFECAARIVIGGNVENYLLQSCQRGINYKKRITANECGEEAPML